MLSLLKRAFYFIGSSVIVLYFYSICAMWLPGIQLKWETTFRWNQMKPYTLEFLFQSSFPCPFPRPGIVLSELLAVFLSSKNKIFWKIYKFSFPTDEKTLWKTQMQKKWNTALYNMDYITKFYLLIQLFPSIWGILGKGYFSQWLRSSLGSHPCWEREGCILPRTACRVVTAGGMIVPTELM